MHCPRDGSILATNDVGTTRHYSCESCGGHWIPLKVLRSVLEADEMATLQSLAASALPTELKCVSCKVPLAGITLSGVEIDRCPTCHGVWFDGGELKKLSILFKSDSHLRELYEEAPEMSPWAVGFHTVEGTLLMASSAKDLLCRCRISSSRTPRLSTQVGGL